MSHSAVRQPGRVAAVQAGVAYLLVIVVGATVLLVSAYYLLRLAVLVHMPGWLAWSLPVALDAGAAGATLCWVSARGATARAWGRALALGALVASLAGNALSHLIEADLIRVTPLLVILIGAVYPAMLWAMVHLALVLRAEHSAPGAEASGPVGEPASDASPMDHQAELAVAQGAAVEVAADASPAVPSKRQRSTAAQRRRWITARLDAGHQLSGGDVERRFGSRNGARELAQVQAARQVTASEVGAV